MLRLAFFGSSQKIAVQNFFKASILKNTTQTMRSGS